MRLIWKSIKLVFFAIILLVALCLFAPILAVWWVCKNISRTILPFVMFIAGICFPLLYLTINWEDLLARETTAIIMVFVPLGYWKLLDLMNKKTIPLLAVLAIYFVAFATLLTVYLSPNI